MSAKVGDILVSGRHVADIIQPRPTSMHADDTTTIDDDDAAAAAEMPFRDYDSSSRRPGGWLP